MTKFTIETPLLSKACLPEWFLAGYLKSRGGGALAGIQAPALKAQMEHGVNVAYIVAHAALETAWGRSAICREKHNLFGFCAYDATPYSSARAFPSYAECISYVIPWIKTHYLTEGGRYFAGACLGHRGIDPHGMNAHYATDPNWGRKIATIANNILVSYDKSIGAH